MKPKIFSLLTIFLLINTAKAQKSAWSTLGIVSVTSTYDPAYGIETKKVKVSSAVKLLEGKEIEIEGYFIPLTGKVAQNHFMLSKFNEKMCFFCGKAGPETAAQVILADKKTQAYSDEKIKVIGILRINENDPSGLLYTLEQARVINQ